MKLKINFPADKEVRSLPSRECGLKLFGSLLRTDSITVTPFAGVWIEMISKTASEIWESMSLPSRECGLKSHGSAERKENRKVTPFAGVWIEIAQR